MSPIDSMIYSARCRGQRGLGGFHLAVIMLGAQEYNDIMPYLKSDIGDRIDGRYEIIWYNAIGKCMHFLVVLSEGRL